MLRVVKLLSQSGKKEYWELFNPDKDIWVVSDLKAKIYLKSRLLEKNEIIKKEPVKRAAEFWAEIFKYTMPEFEPLSFMGQWAYAKKFLKSYQDWPWSKRPKAADTLLKALRQISQFICHPEAAEINREFSREFPQPSFFKELLQACIDFYLFCLDQKKIPHYFVPQLISEHFNSWQNLEEIQGKIFFDLSTELLETEVDAINKLLQFTDVYVFIPAGIERLNRAYKNLGLGLAHVEFLEKGQGTINVDVKIWRCVSQASEARCAVEYAAHLIQNKKVKPQNICIAAQDISIYENLLYHDLSWEGVGINRDLTSPAAGQSFFREINAKLKVILSDWDWVVISEAFPDEIEPKNKKLLKPAIQTDQIFIESLQKKVLFLEQKHPQEEIYFSDFSLIINSLLPQNFSEAHLSHVLSVLHKLRTQTHNLKLDFSIWVELWQKTCAQQDIKYFSADKSGVHVVDFRSIDEINADYLIVLGLNSEPPQKNYVGELGSRGIKFFLEKGFDFNFPFSEWTECLRWYLAGGYKEIVWSYPHSDSKGSTLSPSSFWIDQNAKYHGSSAEFHFVKDTQWLQLQKNIFSQESFEYVGALKNWSKAKGDEFKSGFIAETNLAAEVNVKWPIDSLSASAIESYWACPFKFLASYGFGLSDDQELDVEPTPSVKGQILHKCAEIILKNLDIWDTKSLTQLVDEQGNLQKIVTSDVWPSTRVRLVRQLERFVKQEKTWQKLFPLSQCISQEQKIEGFIQWHNGELNLENKLENGFKWKGRIDRIDMSADGMAVLIDYKDKSAGLNNIKSWKANGQFQLALYAESVRKGLSDIKVKEVIGAFYYSLRNLERNKGFLRKEFNINGFLPENLPRNALVDEITFNNYQREIFEEVGACITQMQNAEFTPSPKKESICETCSWNQLCRAKHLL